MRRIPGDHQPAARPQLCGGELSAGWLITLGTAPRHSPTHYWNWYERLHSSRQEEQLQQHLHTSNRQFLVPDCMLRRGLPRCIDRVSGWGFGGRDGYRELWSMYPELAYW